MKEEDEKGIILTASWFLKSKWMCGVPLLSAFKCQLVLSTVTALERARDNMPRTYFRHSGRMLTQKNHRALAAREEGMSRCGRCGWWLWWGGMKAGT
jgi:hypothetical protein